MKRILCRVPRILSTVLCVFCTITAVAADKPHIGVTLHPYYSFAVAVAGDAADVVPLIGAGFNPHAYEPQPEDIKRAATLDALIVNGVGHDEFAFEILDAAQMRGKLPLVYANEGVALIPVAGSQGEKVVNSHTFISITTSIQQVHGIVNGLAQLFPENAVAFRANGRAYAARLRRLKAGYMERISALGTLDFRCVTIHGAYDYLLQEFGLQVSSVIEPRHGVKPNASQLRDTIEQIRALDADVVFSELHFSDEYVDTIRAATGITVHSFSHISGGEFTPEKFEREMTGNLEALTTALEEAARRRSGGADVTGR